MAESERIGVLEAKFDAHSRADDVGFQRIYADTSEIKETLRTMAIDLRSSVERIHGRIDEEAGKARHGLNNTNAAIQAEVTLLKQDARITTAALSDRIAEQKVWILTGVVAMALTVVGWLADHYMSGAHGAS